MEIFTYPFLSVSFSFFSQNEWLDSRGVSPQTNSSLAIWYLGGCTKIKRLQVEKPWELNIGSQVRLQAAFLPPGVCLFFPGTFLPDSSWEPAPQRWKATLWAMAMSASTSSKGLDNGSNGSTNSPYFIVICPQLSCTEGQEGELRLKTKDRTAQLTILSLHTQYNMYGSLYLTPGTVPNCTRKTEIYVMGTKNTTNLRAGLEPATYFAG